MSERANLLVQQWLLQSNLSNNDLQQMAEDYPYCSAVQLLLLQGLDKTSERYAAHKSRAALHVYNPMLLEADGEMFDFPFEEREPSEPIEDQKDFETFSKREALAADSFTEPVSIEEKEADIFVSATEEATLEEKEFIKIEPEPDLSAETDLQEQETEVEETDITSAKAANDIVATEETTEADNTGSFAPQQAEPNHLEPLLKMPQFNPQAPVAASAGAITFEPFHTVDYFASLGIKLSQAEAGNDRFGKQLKSFTEWLKTMKKIPTTAITQNTDGAGESKVANLAAHSLQNTDIITEAMAEVWVKQGNWEKASEVYNKLSLQNPSKKAYFAAKIESLKKPS